MNPLLLILFILLLLLISLVLRLIYKKKNSVIIKNKIYNLENDGITVIPKILTTEQANTIRELVEEGKSMEAKQIILNSPSVKERIINIIGNDYDFHDYIFIIKKSQFHACHRDYNGDFFNKTQAYPSYTLIIYLEDMEKCLDIIPESHKSAQANLINITDYTESVICSKGDALLFNANLIHSGSLNKRQSNPRIQMKISHKVDREETLGFFQQYNKVLNKESNHPKWAKNLQKHISCVAPVFSQLTQKYDSNKYRGENNNMSNIISKLFYAKLDNI